MGLQCIDFIDNIMSCLHVLHLKNLSKNVAAAS